MRLTKTLIAYFALALLASLLAKADDFTLELNISRNNLNRLVFPFRSLSINTISTAQLKTDKGTVYVLADSDADITLFVSEPDGEESFLVTLHPTDIKAQDLKIRLPKSYLEEQRKKEVGRSLGVEVNKANSYEEELMAIIKEFWLSLLDNRAKLLANGLERDLTVEEALLKPCGSSLSEEVIGVVETDKYLIYLSMLTNPLNIKTTAQCSSEPIAYSILNTNSIAPGDSKYVLTLYAKEEPSYAR